MVKVVLVPDRRCGFAKPSARWSKRADVTRRSLATGLLTAILTLNAPMPVLVSPAAAQTDQDQIAEAVAEIYGWQQDFEQTVDGFIAETQKYGFWSGSENKDTESQRIGRARELMLENRLAILDSAKNNVLETFRPDELEAHLQRIRSDVRTSKDDAIVEQIQKIYYDAVFNGLQTFGAQASKEIDG
ncbi:hypothetical protein [Consotaella aegiceratis]|uniref:hypothetical protein n=1 Tax=Consotaella aegiceratis TaxID=3097961 RepID=UPI002F3F411F